MTSEILVPTFGTGWGHAQGLANVTPPSVPKGADQVIDRILIHEVIAAYCWSVDEERYDLMTAVLTEDFDFQGCIAGVTLLDHVTSAAALVAWLQAWQATRSDQLRHCVTNIVVTAQTDLTADAYGYVTLKSSVPDSLTALATAFYRFTLKKHDGNWRIASIYSGYDRAF
jgi:hypothetical protein